MGNRRVSHTGVHNVMRTPQALPHLIGDNPYAPSAVPKCGEATRGFEVWNADGTNRARITARVMFPSVHG